MSARGTLHGTITDIGGENCDFRGFVWDITSRGDPGDVAPGASAYASNWTESGSYGVAAFSHEVTGLAEGDTFYVRACAHNSAGWSYGGQVSFTTPQELTAAVVSVASSIQSSAIAGSGNAPLSAAVVGVSSSVQSQAIAGVGTAPLTAGIVAVTSSVVTASIRTSVTILTGTVVSVSSSVQTASISGLGTAPLTGTVISVASSVVQATIVTTQILTATVIQVTTSVPSSGIAGLGIAPLAGTIVSATSSVVQASIENVAAPQTLTAAVIEVLASVAAANISGSGTANLTEAAIAVSATVNRAVITGAGIANLVAGYVSVVSSVASGQIGLLLPPLLASPLAVVSSVVGTNITLSWVLVCEGLGIEPARLEATRIPICRPKRRYT